MIQPATTQIVENIFHVSTLAVKSARQFSFRSYLTHYPNKVMFLNFTPRAQQALKLAREEADRLHHNFVGTAHLLMGLIASGQGVSVTVLSKLGLSLENLRLEVEKQTGKGPDQKPEKNIPYAPPLKRVLASAARYAEKLNHAYVGTEHLLLGILEGGSGAAQLLTLQGIDIEHVRLEILKELNPVFVTTPSEPKELKGLPEGFIEEVGKFTPRAQQMMALAAKEADRLQHHFTGTEHLLLGLLALNQGTAINVLRKFGLDLASVQVELEQVGTGPGGPRIGTPPCTPRVKKILEWAEKEAADLRHNYVGTEHILLGMLHEKEGVAARVLMKFGVHLDQTRAAILKEINPNA